MNQARRISSATQHFRNSQDAKDLFPLATVFDSGPASPTLARASEGNCAAPVQRPIPSLARGPVFRRRIAGFSFTVQNIIPGGWHIQVTPDKNLPSFSASQSPAGGGKFSPDQKIFAPAVRTVDE